MFPFSNVGYSDPIELFSQKLFLWRFKIPNRIFFWGEGGPENNKKIKWNVTPRIDWEFFMFFIITRYGSKLLFVSCIG